MLKEPYVKPEVKSEILEPEALGCFGSGEQTWLSWGENWSSSYCCDHD